MTDQSRNHENAAHILVADHDAQTLESARRLLQRNGFKVTATSDLASAWPTSATERPDLILSADFRELSSAAPAFRDVPLILITDSLAENSPVDGLIRQADDFLVKPFSDGELLARVNSQLALSQARREMEAAGKRDRERVEFLTSAAQVGVWFCDLPFDTLEWDDRVKEHFWLPPEAVVTIDLFFERIHPEDRERTRLDIEESIKKQTRYDIDYRTVSPEGRVKWIRAIGHAHYDAQGSPIRFDGITIDITQRRRADDELREQKRILELLKDTGAAIASQLDLQTVVQIVTDAATKLCGANFGAFFYNTTNDAGESYALYTLSGAPREAFEKFGMPRNTPVFSATFSGEGIVRSDDITQDPRYGKMAPHHGMPKGHLPVRSYLAVPVISRTGEVTGGLFFGHPERGVFSQQAETIVAGIASQASIAIDNANLYQAAQREIKERKRVADELQIAREKLSEHAEDLEDQVAVRTASLQEALSQLEEFSYSVSHDLRAPVRAINGYSKILREDFGNLLPPQALTFLDKIDRGALRMDRLVNDVLAMSRVGRAEIKLHPIKLQPFIEEIVEQNPAMQSAQAKIQIIAPHSALGDELPLSQAITNLISNAVKFVEPGTGATVTIRSVPLGDRVRIYIEDQGVGIAEAHRDKLFGMFQRLPSKSHFEGTGIGLAIVRKAAERMGGSVGMESNTPKGSRFWIELKGAA